MNDAAQQRAAAGPQRKPSRMTLGAITTGRVQAPYRILVHGVDGVGKSTFGASAPRPVFLGPEDGTGHLDVARFPVPQSWEDVFDALRTLATDESGTYKTLVVDSVDWLEPLIFKAVAQKAGVEGIEDVGGGFGKGYVAALDEWRRFFAAVEHLQRARGMHVVLVGHSHIKPFRNPEGDDFERYILKLNEKAAALLREWVSGVYFANYETFATVDKRKRVRGVSTGARLLFTQRTAAFDAKDRYGLPESLPLDWAEFDAKAQAGQVANPEALRAECERKAKQLTGKEAEKAAEALGRAGDDTTRLAQLNSWINAKLAEASDTEPEPAKGSTNEETTS